jgi:uncharacterized membrane protein
MLRDFILVIGIMAKSWLGISIMIVFAVTTAIVIICESNSNLRREAKRKKDFMKKIKSYGDKLSA